MVAIAYQMAIGGVSMEDLQRSMADLDKKVAEVSASMRDVEIALESAGMSRSKWPAVSGKPPARQPPIPRSNTMVLAEVPGWVSPYAILAGRSPR